MHALSLFLEITAQEVAALQQGYPALKAAGAEEAFMHQ
jgi:hypothetical protein